MGACFARARKIFATARMLAFSFKGARLFEISLVLLMLAFSFKVLLMLAFSFKGARLFEISLVLLYSYFLYINNISVMTWLRQILKG